MRLKGGRPKKYPDMWICKMCGQKFPNKTGKPRKYCSQKCYGRFLSKRPPKTAFKKKRTYMDTPFGEVEIIMSEKEGTVDIVMEPKRYKELMEKIEKKN